jgi:segregation and condensation protein B
VERRSEDGENQSQLRRLARVEALLFVAHEPLTTRRIAKLANLADGTEARTQVEQLKKQYRLRGSGLTIEQVAGGYRLVTRGSLAPWVQKLHGVSADHELTPAAHETLAVVAYRQPVLRAEIEAIRGVQCGELLRQLIQRDLLRIVGRSQELGRPLQYGTTKRFLEAFGLCDLTQLPPIDETNEAVGKHSDHRQAA